jgi:hypothetical protein
LQLLGVPESSILFVPKMVSKEDGDLSLLDDRASRND